MGKKYLKYIHIFICFILISACAQLNQNFDAIDINSKLKKGELVQKVENCLIIVDRSGSMAYLQGTNSKISIAKYVLNALNQTIPDLKLKMGVRTFGKDLWALESKTAIIYGIGNFSKENFEQTINEKIKWASGKSLLNSAILATADDIKKIKGKCAVILISDGKFEDKNSFESIKKIKRQNNDSIYFHTILVGNDESGKKFLEEIADIGQGEFELAENVMQPEKMALYVENVFLEKPKDNDKDGVYDKFDNCPKTPQNVKVDKNGCPFDNDNDGIYDYQDQCPDTPYQAKVAVNGCPFDTDKDGVLDYLDKCPDTPEGNVVDSDGCIIDSDKDGVNDNDDKCPDTPIAAKVDNDGCWHLKMLNYKSNQKSISAELIKYVDEILLILKNNPEIKLEIHGHTDSRGKKSYNMKLSKKRAKIVMNQLIKLGIEKNRLISKGFGPSKPIESNKTASGRAQNRRVEFKLVK